MNKYDLVMSSIGWFCPGVAGESQAPEQHGVWEAAGIWARIGHALRVTFIDQ